MAGVAEPCDLQPFQPKLKMAAKTVLLRLASFDCSALADRLGLVLAGGTDSLREELVCSCGARGVYHPVVSQMVRMRGAHPSIQALAARLK
jgi:hypothetical protein